MSSPQLPECDLSFVVRVRDDEECVGHVLRRVASHLRSLGCSHEILVADEGSGDNSVAVAALLRPQLTHMELLQVGPGEGYRSACQHARGKVVVLYDARRDAPLSALGFALGRLREGVDVVAVSGRYLVFRRTRAWRAFDALSRRRDAMVVERGFLRRARALRLSCEVTHPPRRRSPWVRLREALLSPRRALASHPRSLLTPGRS